MRTVLIDYGGGNLHSVEKALERAGLSVERHDDPARARGADALVLPGQGHFGQVMASFLASGFEPLVRDHLAQDRPFLGICVGLQILMDGSEEAPGVPGLGLVPGAVRRFPPEASVPQMGWNQLEKHGEPALLAGIPDGSFVYFANSYYVAFEEAAGSDAAGRGDVEGGPAGGRAADANPLPGAVTRYAGVAFRSAVSRGNLHATQFHPEKSQSVGLRILANFRDLATSAASAAGLGSDPIGAAS